MGKVESEVKEEEDVVGEEAERRHEMGFLKSEHFDGPYRLDLLTGQVGRITAVLVPKKASGCRGRGLIENKGRSSRRSLLLGCAAGRDK